MSIKHCGFISIVAIFSAGQVYAGHSTYELTVKGKTCQESFSQTIECDYKIGKSFHISIAGLGQSDTGVTFMKSDFYGDFYATFGLMHGCVVVKPGKKTLALDDPSTFAFISPKNGKVYRDWKECQSGY